MPDPWRPNGYADGVDGDALKAKRRLCDHRPKIIIVTRDWQECELCGARLSWIRGLGWSRPRLREPFWFDSVRDNGWRDWLKK